MKRILIVDDDRAILEYVRRVLGSMYDVTCVQDALEALTVAAQFERLDLVIADYVMPSMSGDEFIGRIHDRWPGARALFLSGYPALVASQVPPVHICLRKPVPPNLLRDTIAYLLRDTAALRPDSSTSSKA